jgi:hypothetical protein
MVGGAANEFLTRIPVPEYGQIGLRGPSGAVEFWLRCRNR